MNTENDEVQVEEVPEVVVADELETLKQRADLMGIKFHPNTGVDKLKAKIENALNPVKEKPVSKKKEDSKKYYLSHTEFLQEKRAQLRKSINNLIRVRVSCMNPNKSAWEGEIISVGSAKLGTFKKYVPFNVDEGWHVPKIIYDAMKERKYSSFTTVRGPRGEKIRKGKLVPEFNIEVLPPLTPQELKDLAQRQAMAAGN